MLFHKADYLGQFYCARLRGKPKSLYLLEMSAPAAPAATPAAAVPAEPDNNFNKPQSALNIPHSVSSKKTVKFQGNLPVVPNFGTNPPPTQVKTFNPNEHVKSTASPQTLDLGPPNFTADNNNDANSVNEETRAEANETPVTPISPCVNPKKRMLLRIGLDNSSEYVELRKQRFTLQSPVNAQVLGSESDLRRLYGIGPQDSELCGILQDVFGVKSYGDFPRFKTYMKLHCKFPGIESVVRVLEKRRNVLGQSVSIMQQSLVKSRNEHFLKWLDETLESLKKISTNPSAPACPAEDEDPSNTEDKKKPGFFDGLKNPFKSAGCPCLEDLNLLRDLVWLLVMMDGTARPEVRQVVDSITLQKLLKASSRANQKNILEDILSKLRKLQGQPGAAAVLKANSGDVQAALKRIREILNPNAPKNAEVNLEALLDDIRALVDKANKVQTTGQQVEAVEQDQSDCLKRIEILQRLLDGLQKGEGAAAEEGGENGGEDGGEEDGPKPEPCEEDGEDAASVDEATRGVSNLQQQLNALRAKYNALVADKVTEIDESLAEDNTTKGELEAKLAAEKARAEDLGAQLEELREQHAAEIASLRAELASIQGAKAALQAPLAALDKTVSNQSIQVQEANATTNRLAELEGVRSELDALKARHAANLASIKKQLTDAQAKMLALQKLISDGAAADTAKNAATAAEKAAAEARMADLQAKLAAAEAEKEAATKSGPEQTAAYEAAKAALEARIEELEGKIASSAEGLAKEKANRALEIAQKDSLVRVLESQLGTAQTQLHSLVTNLQKAKQKSNANATEKARLQKEIEDFRQKLEAAKVNLAAAKAGYNAGAAETQKTVNSLTAQLTKKEEELGKATAAGAAKNAQITTLQKQLAEKAAAETARDSAIDATVNAQRQQLVELEDNLRDAKVALGVAQENLEQKEREYKREIAQVRSELEEAEEAMEVSFGPEQIAKEAAEKAAAKKAVDDAKAEVEAAKAEVQRLKDELGAKGEMIPKGGHDALQAQLAELQRELEGVRTALASAAEDMKKKTKKRLETLLGTLLLSEDSQRKAIQYIMSDSADLPQLDEIGAETCEFFLYLTNILNIQMTQIATIVKNAKLGGGAELDFSKDILEMFAGLPAGLDKSALRKDLTALFQQIFIKTSDGGQCIISDTEMPGSFETLGAFLRGFEVREQDEKQTPLKAELFGKATQVLALIKNLASLGCLNQNAVMVGKDGQINVIYDDTLRGPLNEFIFTNTRRIVPVVILAILYIQLLQEDLRVRYDKIKARCTPK